MLELLSVSKIIAQFYNGNNLLLNAWCPSQYESHTSYLRLYTRVARLEVVLAVVILMSGR